MAVAFASHDLELDLPWHWPEALSPAVLAQYDRVTPFLVCDLNTVRARYNAFVKALPRVRCFYAVKCNPAAEVIQALDGLGCSFEIASLGELQHLQALGIEPAEMLYSNPVKAPSQIAGAYQAGLWRFAADSETELYKLARHAPGSAVILRVRVDDSTSVFPLSRKFGAEPHQARGLLKLARRLGLRPYGVSFHVGSQCTDPAAWRGAIAAVAGPLTQLARDGIQVEMLNMSGGFPARYTTAVPDLEEIAEEIRIALHRLMPYLPGEIAAEPGRHLVAESSVMVSEVIGREVRAGDSWIYLDVGAYNGLIETQQTRNRWRYPLWSSRADHASAPIDRFTVTGPTCDSSDTLFFGAALPSTIGVGDRLYIGSAGAYTLSYASSFNGFGPPEFLHIG